MTEPTTAAGRALLDDALYRCSREAHETDGSARLRAILAIEQEARAEGDRLAAALRRILDHRSADYWFARHHALHLLGDIPGEYCDHCDAQDRSPDRG